MTNQSNFPKAPSSYSWFINAMDTADIADRNTNTGKTPPCINTHKLRNTIVDWVAQFSWLPLWRLNTPNPH